MQHELFLFASGIFSSIQTVFKAKIQHPPYFLDEAHGYRLPIQHEIPLHSQTCGPDSDLTPRLPLPEADVRGRFRIRCSCSPGAGQHRVLTQSPRRSCSLLLWADTFPSTELLQKCRRSVSHPLCSIQPTLNFGKVGV